MICNRLPYVLPVKQETLYPLLDETDAPGSSHRCLGLARWPAVHRCLELCLQSAEKKAKSYKVCSIKATATFTDVNSKWLLQFFIILIQFLLNLSQQVFTLQNFTLPNPPTVKKGIS